MWWIVLAAGVAAVAFGILSLVRYFLEAAAGSGSTGGGPAQRLVAAAMFTAAGLFLSFVGLANLVAEQAARGS